MQKCKPFRFHTPSSILVVGPSGCGKTVFTQNLLLENLDLFETPPNQVHYCYGAWQDGFRTMKEAGVLFHEGIPEHQELIKRFPKGRGILVLDDLMDAQCAVAIVSLHLERLFGNLSQVNVPPFWILGFGFASRLVGRV